MRIRGYCALNLAFLAMRLAFCAPKRGKSDGSLPFIYAYS